MSHDNRPVITEMSQASRDDLAELEDLYAALSADVDILAGAPTGEKGTVEHVDPTTLPPHARRNLVRAVFAFLEGITYRLKCSALAEAARASRQIDDAERALLKEEVADLDHRGRMRRRAINLRLKANVRFAFTMFSRAHGAQYALQVSGRGWEAFQRATTVRHRLMHPKELRSIDVSDDEIRDTIQTYLWFNQQVALLLISSIRQLRSQTELLRATRAASEDTVGAPTPPPE